MVLSQQLALVWLSFFLLLLIEIRNTRTGRETKKGRKHSSDLSDQDKSGTQWLVEKKGLEALKCNNSLPIF
jgi:hypothetical protein